jgi:hypothetical protein
MRAQALISACGMLFISGCSNDGRRSDDGVPGLGSSAGLDPSATEGGPEEEDDDDPDADESDAGSDSLQFDVAGGDPDAMPPPDSGCRGVDFLFVVDNSGSMDNEQAALVGAFPGFMQTIADTLDAGSDFHILVADTDAWSNCGPGNCPAELCRDPIAGDYICEQAFDACDKTLGAGVVHPAGQLASNAQCNPAGGNRYILANEPDLVGTFSCMATVGVSGDGDETPMDAMVAALADPMNAAGGCNDGFLRDDALLVITFISDDPHYIDSGDPHSWYQAVVTAKNGDPAGVVVLGLTPNWPGCREDHPEAIRGAHWAQFIALWANQGLHGNVCSTAAEYVAFFEDAVAPIVDACEGFEPPG